MVKNITLSSPKPLISYLGNLNKINILYVFVNSWIKEEVSLVLAIPATQTVAFQMANNVGFHNFLKTMKI